MIGNDPRKGRDHENAPFAGAVRRFNAGSGTTILDPFMRLSLCRRAAILGLAAIASLAACDTPDNANLLIAPAPVAAPPPALPVMRWDHRGGSDAWTQAALAALDREGVAMVSQVPQDIGHYCPGYAAQGPDGRKAFWVGLTSALARHESTYNPAARGGGGRWLGLMQISPATWRHYGCSGDIMNGADNASCAMRIMARQVGRDNAVARDGSGRWRGVARDWAPLRVASKRDDIAGWTRQQSYCQG
ncbi:MAG: transglycosylase SLT domain-containing protein [Paracoccus sp. (in: a-proteobacteria)]|nr:transglycosylase SLT domain-containing protein [Paracoccus sp. (in: a-proteobacteria)]